ncbi:MAG: adenosine deaminase [Frankiales bacterium]|nr:adenosine deaminase [Frankiales bacterium]
MGEVGRVYDTMRGMAVPTRAAPVPARDVAALPKAHLHLHLAGAMRPATLVELAAAQGRRLPPELLDPHGARVDVTARRGWARFQRAYDAARDVITGPDQVRRLMREIAEDERAAGSGWVEVQVDPSSYSARLGGLQATVELVLDAMASAERATGTGMALIVAANRTRHPGDAETLARLARRFAGAGVVGFGLSNDETRGRPEEFEKAFRIAREAGLLSVPHAGELRGSRSVLGAVQVLHADRLGHGVRSVEDPATVALLAERGVVLEVCPASNVALGVAGALEAVPVRQLREAGVRVALGADDPLIFRSGLVEQYAAVRDQSGLSDEALAGLARDAVEGSAAPPAVKDRLRRGITAWLAAPGGPTDKG